MTLKDIVLQRKSVRTFDGRALREEDLAPVREEMQNASSPYGLPIEFRLLSATENKNLTSPVIIGAETYIAGKMRRALHAEEAFGYVFEQIIICAQRQGLGSVWIAGTMDRPAFEKAMDLGGGEVMPCVSPLGYPAARRSLRETMMRKGIHADSRLPSEELFFDRSFDTPLSGEKLIRWQPVLELVRWAPSAVNKQPWRLVVSDNLVHFYEKRSRGYVSADGWDLQKIDIGIAMCHFALGMEEQQMKADFLLDDPGIPVPADTVYVASYTVQ